MSDTLTRWFVPPFKRQDGLVDGSYTIVDQTGKMACEVYGFKAANIVCKLMNESVKAGKSSRG